jgi:hypothetical protein
MDGRSGDGKAGWKGKGVWTTWATRAPFHSETGKARCRRWCTSTFDRIRWRNEVIVAEKKRSAEFFNLFNRIDFAALTSNDPSVVLGAGFGYATSTPDSSKAVLGPGGQRQFGLKLTYQEIWIDKQKSARDAVFRNLARHKLGIA